MATNRFHVGGRRLFNQIFNGGTARPTSIWIGLRICNGVGSNPADAADADSMTSNLSEVSPTNTGYARVQVTNNTTNFPETLSGIDSILTLASQAFNFSGSALPVNGVTHAFICTGTTATDTTGILIASIALAATRNFASGDQENVVFMLAAEGAYG